MPFLVLVLVLAVLWKIVHIVHNTWDNERTKGGGERTQQTIDDTKEWECRMRLLTEA